jgi:hypothetical protein
MKCPKCAAEMAEDALSCAACGTENVAEPNTELVCVQMVSAAAECQVIASLLQAEGIPVALHNQVGSALRGLADGQFTWDPSDAAVRIMVPKPFEQVARELLAAQLPEGADTGADETGTPSS